MSYKPEDVMSDSENTIEKKGATIRKGTMAAAFANAEIIESVQSSAEEKQAAINALKELIPAMKAFGVTKFMTWKNPQIQKLFDDEK